MAFETARCDATRSFGASFGSVLVAVQLPEWLSRCCLFCRRSRRSKEVDKGSPFSHHRPVKTELPPAPIASACPCSSRHLEARGSRLLGCLALAFVSAHPYKLVLKVVLGLRHLSSLGSPESGLPRLANRAASRLDRRRSAFAHARFVLSCLRLLLPASCFLLPSSCVSCLLTRGRRACPI